MPRPPRATVGRWITIVLLACFIVTAAWIWFATPMGERLRNHYVEIGIEAKAWTSRHWLIAPLIFVLAYVAISISLCLPVWWLQILAGCSFGLLGGLGWTSVGAVCGAMCTLDLSRWLGADWFHNRVEPRMKKLQQIDDKMGSNGLLVVMAVRLAHVLPFSLSNYLFGLTRVRPRDVAIGTLLGGLPSILICVTIGVNPDLLKSWRYISAIVALNVLLLLPVIVRYLFPKAEVGPSENDLPGRDEDRERETNHREPDRDQTDQPARHPR